MKLKRWNRLECFGTDSTALVLIGYELTIYLPVTVKISPHWDKIIQKSLSTDASHTRVYAVATG